MAISRSPNYPQMALGEAIDAIRKAYKAEGRNKMSRLVLASHLGGYSSLNGRALAKIGAVRAYGLISGKEDELRITNEAINCLEAPIGSNDRRLALTHCAFNPPIFKEIYDEYPTTPSEQNLRFFLVKKLYSPEAASKAVQNYLDTVRLVEEEGGVDPRLESPLQDVEDKSEPTLRTPGPLKPTLNAESAPAPGTRRSVFPLDEGDVTLVFPSNLSADGYAELKEYLDIFLRRAERLKRREEAGREKQAPDEDDHSDIA